MPAADSSSPFRSDLLAGQTAMVTGSSSGIGQSIAVAMAAAGARVLLHAQTNSEGLATTRQQMDAPSEPEDNLLCDFGQTRTCLEFAERAWQRGPIDIWVNNAGIDVLTGDAAQWSFEKKFSAAWEVDVQSTVTLSRAVGAKMASRGSGVILNIGWDQASVGMEGDSGEMFAATKGAVMAFTQSLAKSLAPKVRANCIAPGWIRTKWSETASEFWDHRARAEALVERWGEPTDVAHAAVFLASPAASFITGQVLKVNGGFAGAYRESDDLRRQG